VTKLSGNERQSMSFDQQSSEVEQTRTGPVPATTMAKSAAVEFGRLHPTSLLFDLLSHVRSLVIPAILGLFGAANGDLLWVAIAGVIFLPTLAVSTIRYLSLRFCIKDRELVVSEGIFFQRNRTVPVKRIQNIDLVQNVLHRLFRVAEVRIETASGTEPEATLRVLNVRDVEKLRTAIFQRRESAAGETCEKADGETLLAAPNATVKASEEVMLQIPASLLVKAGLASNRGMILIGVLFGLYFQFDLEERFDFNRLGALLPQGLTNVQEVLMATGSVIFVLAFLRLLGVIWYILRFHGYRLSRIENDLRITCGLFTKLSATVPRKRIQFISIHRNLLMRWMGLATIRIETAGGAGKDNQDATKSVSSRWFVPVLREDRIPEILVQLRPGLVWSEQEFDWHPLSPRTSTRLARISVVISILIGAVGLGLTRPWGWALGVAALPCLIFLAIKKSRAMRYARTDDMVIYRSGVLSRKTSITFFEKMQTLKVQQSYFDRRWDMATLSVDTAAAGPAEHKIRIPYLSSDFAHDEYNELIKKAASHQPVFG
jgi:putative membrane protein